MNRSTSGSSCGSFFAVALDHAAHRHQPAAGPRLLVAGGFEQGVDGFAHGAFQKPAGVDHQDLGLRRFRGQLKTGQGELVKQDFTVHQILHASQIDNGGEWLWRLLLMTHWGGWVNLAVTERRRVMFNIQKTL